MTALLARGSLIKICGVTNVKDARDVLAAGATALGLNFADVPRRIDLGVAREVSELTKDALVRVGVFRDRSDDEILAILEQIDVDAVQLHDSLSGRLLEEVRSRGLGVIKALSITSDDFLTFPDESVDAILIDGPRSGSGETHDWSPMTARHFRVPWIAAGGLTPENVADLIHQWRPWGVDTASGVESVIGVKDSARVGNFVANAQSAFIEKEA